MSEVAVSRRQFLRGDLRGGRAGIRPPWALAEAAFTAACTRCDDCIAACPESVITRGSGGYPEMDFSRAACTFCGKCAAACTVGAFRAERADSFAAWTHRAAIGPTCLAANGVVCRACGDHCRTGAIRFRLAPAGRSFAHIDVGRCTGCGGCVGVCPVGAVAMRIGVPAEAVA